MVLPRFVVRDGQQDLLLPTEYNHFEGALAVAHRVPRLIVVADGIARRGIASEAGAKLPTDLGGVIYAHLQDRNDISTIGTRLRKFLEDRL